MIATLVTHMVHDIFSESAGGNKPGDPFAILAAGIPALSMQLHGSFSGVGTQLWGCKSHDIKEVEYVKK